MRLFKYEMKKLLFNKNRLVLLGVLFILYASVSFLSSSGGEFEIEDRAQEKIALSQFMALVSDNAGKFDPEQFEKSKTVVEATKAQYGAGEQFNYNANRNPGLRFHSIYTQFGQRAKHIKRA